MEITTRFNRFYHSAVLTDLFKKSNKLVFRHLKDTRTNGAFTVDKYIDYDDMDDLKQLLKLLNLDYSVSEDLEGKVSTKDIDTKALIDHIEFVIQVGIHNGIELNFVAEEFDRMIKQYGER